MMWPFDVLSIAGAMNGVAAWLLKQVVDAFLAILKIIEHGLLVSPNITALPQVQALTGRSVAIVNATFVLVFVAAGTLVMVGGSDERARYTVKDLLPRAVVGFVAAHFTSLLLSTLIRLANAVTAAVTGQRLDDTGALRAMSAQVQAAAQNPTSPLLAAVLIGIIAVLLATTTLALVSRVAGLLVLAVIAPIALALHALPQTDPIARLWWQATAGCLVTPVLQAFTLQAGSWMLLDPQHMLPMLGLPGDPGATANLLVVIVLLWTTVRIPALVARYLNTGGPRQSFLGTIVRVVVVQHGTRALGAVARGR
ncbi:type IV secretion system protein [Phytohabitans kaempferiae]|uniref:Type IV secretion system protein n=1 Tax=Phytohabitans kaempferiae TaxID=1620943 RepID=A0ABV6MBL2_9ACTN